VTDLFRSVRSLIPLSKSHECKVDGSCAIEHRSLSTVPIPQVTFRSKTYPRAEGREGQVALESTGNTSERDCLILIRSFADPSFFLCVFFDHSYRSDTSSALSFHTISARVRKGRTGCRVPAVLVSVTNLFRSVRSLIPRSKSHERKVDGSCDIEHRSISTVPIHQVPFRSRAYPRAQGREGQLEVALK
jgi:hypothetical protein